MASLCNLQIRVNSHFVFFINQNIICTYSGSLKKMIQQEGKKKQIKNSVIEIPDFPGGPYGFELISRFCYKNGEIEITASNVCLLHCCAVFLSMTEKVCAGNLLQQTEMFFSGMFYWSWNDVIWSLKSCESFFSYADSCGIIEKIVCAVLAKIAQNLNIDLICSSSSTSPELRLSSSSKATPDSIEKPKSIKEWWFDGLTVLSPKIIERIIKSLGAYGYNNKSLVITKFLLHYLKTKCQNKVVQYFRFNYSGLADTAVYGVVSVGKTEFSCRKLFWVLRLVSGFRLSKVSRIGLERLIGLMLDQATLDDLLVSGHECVYDVGFVLRLIREFVNGNGVLMTQQKMKKLGRLIDKYLTEISPDQKLEFSKFLAVAESLPGSARDCFDDVYRAVDIYLQSHLSLSFEERSRICRCLNYSKLTLRACKDLAKNPRIPPNVAVQALMSQQSKVPQEHEFECEIKSDSRIILYKNSFDAEEKCSSVEALETNLERMQWRVVELEKICREMKGQMKKMVRGNLVIFSSHCRTLPKLCK